MTPSPKTKRPALPRTKSMPPKEAIRLWRSPYSHFYKGEARHAAEVYTTACLQEIADAGFNAIWIRGIMHELVPSTIFPEFGKQSAAHLRSLRQVIARGKKVGLRVFLYMQPTLGRPFRDPFWKQHPQAKGSTYLSNGKLRSAMCTSTDQVQKSLKESAQRLSLALPDLGGLILITASEHISHCLSHEHMMEPPEAGLTDGNKIKHRCPRCFSRPPRELICEILSLMQEGLKVAGNGAELIAWNWSWSFYEPEPQQKMIQMLPEGIRLMAGFERGDQKHILGKMRKIDEYSLSFAGPSQRFLKSLHVARKRQLSMMTKLQIGATHELATVANLPLIGNLYDKAKGMRHHGIDSFMGCWNFGNMLTANTASFLFFLDAPRLPARNKAMEQFAASYFPGCDPSKVRQAWEGFEQAMAFYPFCVSFLYYSPVNYAVARPIVPGPMDGKLIGPSWLYARRGDDLSQSIGTYTLTEILRGLAQLTRLWQQGVKAMEQGLAGCDKAHESHAAAELRTAKMAGHCFHSGWNLYRAYRLRKNWKPNHLAALQKIMCDEKTHLPEALALAESDPRMGFHSECQRYLFTASGIRQKLRQLNKHIG